MRTTRSRFRIAVGASTLGLVALAMCKPRPPELPAGTVGVTELTASERERNDAGAPDPLPSWRDTPTKRALVDFVVRATSAGPEYVGEADRVALFDDGTLWPTRPPPEIEFARGGVLRLAAETPELREQQPFKAALEGDRDYFMAKGVPAVLEVVAATHTGMLQEEYETRVRGFLDGARHPDLGVPYAELAYPCTRELVAWLGEKRFRVHVSSAGEVDFVREMAARTLGIARENVIGTSFVKTPVVVEGRESLYRTPEIAVLVDEENKPASVERHLGRRPVIVVTTPNPYRDVAVSPLLRWVKARPTSFAILMTRSDHEDELADAALRADAGTDAPLAAVMSITRDTRGTSR